MTEISAPSAVPSEVLRRVFGLPAFRGLQEAAVEHIVAGGDALVLMPTGGGKSLCYQIPALCRPGTAVVISPLIALMDDQIASMRQLGISAGALHSEVSLDETVRIGRELNSGRLDLLYLSPERLLAPGMLERLTRRQIALIAIDEAHCVSAWGHEFRPEYRALACLARHFPGVPRVALTATADPRTRIDILSALAMDQAAVFTASFHRPNLHIAVKAKQAEFRDLLEFMARRSDQTGIVYCGSRSKTEQVATKLCHRGIPALPFHAGLSPMEKRVALARFRSGESVVMVATIAFGMGVDRPDVRFVAHLDMPDSPEAFYQQIGRAGRDGEKASTLLLYGGQDIARARHWLSQSSAPEAQKKVMNQRLEFMIRLTETVTCRTRSLLSCFGEELHEPCGHCDNCLTPAFLFDGTVAAQKVLSAIHRTGQRFGALHIVSVLRGQGTPAVLKHHHDKLPTYGIGKDQQARFWGGVIRQLVALGALRTASGEYASLSLVSEHARPILRRETTVMLRKESESAPKMGLSRSRRTTMPMQTAAEKDVASGTDELFTILRQWRAEAAKAQAVPSYVIFHDSVLREVASVKPATRSELAQIKGIGASKLGRYGAAVLGIVARAG